MSKNEREKLKLDRKPEPSKGPKIPDRRPRIMLWVYLAAFMALMLHIFLRMGDVEPQHVEYSRFLEQIKQGYVQEVVLVNDRNVEGVYTSEAVQQGKVEVKVIKPGILT